MHGISLAALASLLGLGVGGCRIFGWGCSAVAIWITFTHFVRKCAALQTVGRFWFWCMTKRWTTAMATWCKDKLLIEWPWKSWYRQPSPTTHCSYLQVYKVATAKPNKQTSYPAPAIHILTTLKLTLPCFVLVERIMSIAWDGADLVRAKMPLTNRANTNSLEALTITSSSIVAIGHERICFSYIGRLENLGLGHDSLLLPHHPDEEISAHMYAYLPPRVKNTYFGPHTAVLVLSTSFWQIEVERL